MSRMEESTIIIEKAAPHTWTATIYEMKHDAKVQTDILTAFTRDGAYRKATRYIRQHTNPYTQTMQIETRTIED